MDSDKLRRALTEAVDGEVRFDAGSRGAYAHDASNYRQPPIGVVVPRTPMPRLSRCYSSRRRVIGTTNHKAPRITAIGTVISTLARVPAT